MSCTIEIRYWTFAFQYLHEGFTFFLHNVNICDFADETTTRICGKNLEREYFKIARKKIICLLYSFENKLG